MSKLIYKLQSIINISPSNNNTDINIARRLLKNLNKIDQQTNIHEFAELCYTSPSGFSRFAKKMGYMNFSEFKRDVLNIKEELDETIIEYHGQDKLDMHDILHHITDALNKIDYARLNRQIDQLCEYMYSASRIILFASFVPGDLASILQRAMLTIGKYAEFYPRIEHQAESVRQLAQNDLCLFLSTDASWHDQKSIIFPAMLSDAKTVLITQNQHIKYSEQLSLMIDLGPCNDELTEKYKLLFFLDCLINRYLNKYVVERHALRHNTHTK